MDLDVADFRLTGLTIPSYTDQDIECSIPAAVESLGRKDQQPSRVLERTAGKLIVIGVRIPLEGFLARKCRHTGMIRPAAPCLSDPDRCDVCANLPSPFFQPTAALSQIAANRQKIDLRIGGHLQDIRLVIIQDDCHTVDPVGDGAGRCL